MQAGTMFQSTRLREARLPGGDQPSCPFTFQSTRLREARPGLNAWVIAIASFNPRACVRRDLTISGGEDAAIWFQSTRLREARQSHHNSLRDKDFFYKIREPVPPLDSKDAGRVGTM